MTNFVLRKIRKRDKNYTGRYFLESITFDWYIINYVAKTLY